MSRKNVGLFALIVLVAGLASSNFARSADSIPPASDKVLIGEEAGLYVEIGVPAAFLPALEAALVDEALSEAGYLPEKIDYEMQFQRGSGNRISSLDFTQGHPRFFISFDNIDKIRSMVAVGNITYTLYPPPVGLQAALDAAKEANKPAAPAQATRPTSIEVITLGNPSDFDHSTNYSSSPLSEKVLIFEGAGQTAVFEIPELLFPILYTCVREGISQKKGESENTKPALDFHIVEGSINRVTKFALADEGIPHFLVVSAQKNLDAIKKMMPAPEPYTYRISSPVPVVPALVAAPAPSKPTEKRMLYAVDGKPITESRAPWTGWGLGGEGAPQWALDALSEEEYETLRRGGTLSE